MNILIWKAKHGDCFYAATTLDQELRAYKMIFDDMENNGDFECCPPEKGRMTLLYNKAQHGDLQAAKQFIQMRRDYEYEYTKLEDITEP